MSQHLIDKLKKSRQFNATAGLYTFTVSRPTDMDVALLRSELPGNVKQGDLFKRFVIDWPGMTELDIIPGGTNTPVPFDTDLFMLWIADKPQLWDELAAAIMTSYQNHQAELEAELGKLSAG